MNEHMALIISITRIKNVASGSRALFYKRAQISINLIRR